MAFLTKRPNGIWNIVVTMPDGKRRFTSTGSRSKTEANRKFAEFQTRKRRIDSGKLLLYDLKEKVMNDAQANAFKPKTLEIYLKVFTHMNTIFGNMEINSISLDDVNRYKVKRLESISKVSINIELKTMKKIFRYAYNNRLLGVEFSREITLLSVTDNKKKIFTELELHKLFESMDEGEFRDACEVAYLTGSRRNEVLNIKYSDIDLNSRRINIYQIKPRKPRTVKPLPITDSLYQVLEKYFFEESGDEKPFNSEDKLFKMSPSWMTHKFKKLIRKLKLNEDLKLHSLRHTTTTTLIRNNTSLPATKEILGHSSIKVTEGYTHLVPGDYEKDLQKLSVR